VYGLDECDQMNLIIYLHVANRPTAFRRSMRTGIVR